MAFFPRILIIRQLALGDVILATPIVEKIYNNYNGECSIDVLTKKPEVFLNNPFVNKVFDIGNHGDMDFPYDVTINLDLAYERKPLMHIVDAYSVYAFGGLMPSESKRPKIYSTLDDRCAADWLISSNRLENYVVLHMRHDTWPSRNIPQDYWRLIVETLLKCTDYKILQVGSTDEYAFNFDDRLIDLRGATNLHVLKELIAKAKLYVGIDSGTLHVAATTDVPILSMFTSAHHFFRMPTGRPKSAKFMPIIPRVNCYGCQSRAKPPITGVVCSEGDPYDPPCIHSFLIEEFELSLRKILEN